MGVLGHYYSLDYSDSSHLASLARSSSNPFEIRFMEEILPFMEEIL